MSPAAALLLALIALVGLGALAGWLLNLPMWAIGTLAVLGGVLARGAFRRLSRRSARQDTETPQ